MWLVVGLGNPGPEYHDTRHNAGFSAADTVARRWGAQWRAEKKFLAAVAKADAREKTMLCKPQTFMNASGDAVGRVAEYFGAAPADTLVIVDDADLPLGMLRLRPGGGTGGHRGLESVTQRLGREFPRLRLGVARPEGRSGDLANHVLGRFRPDEQPLWERTLTRAADQVECWRDQGLEKAMNRFNGPTL